MAKKSLAELSAAFEQKASGGGGGDQTWKLKFPFWKAPHESTSTIRFLPDLDEDNPMGFLVENLTHELVINGKRETVACLKMFGEDCPICTLSQKYYDEKSPDHNEQLGKKYYRKKSYLGQVLVIDTPVEHDATQIVKLIDFGPAIFNQVQAAFKSGDLEEAPYELKGGYNFRIKKTKSGEYASYQTSTFAPKQTDVADDIIAAIELYDLKAYRTPKTGRDQLEAMLVADQTGASLASSEEASAPAAAPAVRTAAAVAPAPAAVATADTASSGGEKKLSVVEQLRARQAAAKAAAEASAD
jgi:hypothetical protein